MTEAPNITLSTQGSISNALQRAVDAHAHCSLVPTAADWMWMDTKADADAMQQAAAAGQNMVLQLPLKTSMTRLLELEKAANKSNATVLGHAPLRTSPMVQWLAKALQEQALGRICMVEWNVFLSAKPAGADPLTTLLYPYLDLQQWLFGPISGINAEFAGRNKQSGIEQAGLVSYRMDTEGIGMIAYTTQLWQQSMETSLVVLGEKGSIKLGGANLNRLEYCQGELSPPDITATETAETTTLNWLVNSNLGFAFGLQDALNIRELTERIYALRNEQHVRKTA